MSSVSLDEKPEFQALDRLQQTIAEVTDELASWRRRAHRAESTDGASGADRIKELEHENEDLRRRMERARERLSDLLVRLRFLEEQTATREV